MAKVTTDPTVIYDWKDGDVIKADDYERERGVIIAAINDTDDKVETTNQYLLVTQIMGVF